MFSHRDPPGATPAQVAALYLAADEARWLAEERGLSSYWEVARILTESLPEPIAQSLEFCWEHADLLAQEAEGDPGYYRRLMCHSAYLREEHPDVYEEIVALVRGLREARACVVWAASEPVSGPVRAGGTASG